MNKELEEFLSNDFKTISINYTEFDIANSSSFKDLQEGYRLNSDLGESFIGVSPGNWKEDWYVVGFLAGDPIFVDVKDNKIYTAMHGAGSWEEERICNSLTDFKTLLDNLMQISKEREYPVKFEKKKKKKKELALYLSVVSRTNAGQDFWLQFVQ